jgi:hypothetical protein
VASGLCILFYYCFCRAGLTGSHLYLTLLIRFSFSQGSLRFLIAAALSE